MYVLSVSFLPVRRTFSAFTTTTKSPASRCGVKLGLFLPRRRSATCTARRPSTAPSASITCHLRWSKLTFGKYVFITNNSKRGETLANASPKSTGIFDFLTRGDRALGRLGFVFGKNPKGIPQQS